MRASTLAPVAPSEARPADVLRLAWPIMVSMASYSIMGLVDSLFVGQLGTSALAAVGLATSATHLASALWIGCLGGVRVLIAQRSGADDLASARVFAWQGIWLALLAGALTACLAPFAPAMLGLFGASGDVVSQGSGYLGVRLVGSTFVFLVFALQGWFQGRGDTRTPMRAVLAGNLLNVVLDPVLIHGLFGFPALGAAGAAVATALAFGVQVVWLGVAASRDLGARVALRWDDLREILRVGLPMGTHFVLDVASFALFAMLLASVGEAHLAAHVVVVRVLMVSVLPGHAIGEATGVLVGRALGGGQPEVARRSWASGTLVAVAIMSVFGVGFLSVPELLLGPFGVEPDVLELGVGVLALAGLVQAFDAVAMVAVGALNGAGDTRFSMVLGLGASWLVKVPVSVAGVALGFGVVGAWSGVAVELVVLALLAVARVRGGTWLSRGAL